MLATVDLQWWQWLLLALTPSAAVCGTVIWVELRDRLARRIKRQPDRRATYRQR